MKAPEIKQLTKEIISLIGELDEFKGRWSATQVLAPDRLAALRQVATIESVGSSSRIEGVRLSNLEIENLLRGVRAYSFRSRDEQEVIGYAELMEMIFTSYKEISLTENHIKQLHGVLLKHSVKDERHRGEYKKFANNVEAQLPDGKKGIIFQTASAFDTPKLMYDLVDWVEKQTTQNELHPLIITAVFVLVFLHIHPFQDGNGRLSRALTTLLLLRFSYSFVPYSSFERVIEENKDSYYLALRRGQTELEGNSAGSDGLNDWFSFFLKSMLKQKRALEAKISHELVAARISPLSLQILELIKNHGSASIGEIVSKTKANRNTVKVHLRKLVESNYLERDGVGRAIRYRMKVSVA